MTTITTSEESVPDERDGIAKSTSAVYLAVGCGSDDGVDASVPLSAAAARDHVPVTLNLKQDADACTVDYLQVKTRALVLATILPPRRLPSNHTGLFPCCSSYCAGHTCLCLPTRWRLGQPDASAVKLATSSSGRASYSPRSKILNEASAPSRLSGIRAPWSPWSSTKRGS